MKKQQTLPPVRANAGLEAEYAAALEKLVIRMHNSVIYWITAAWRKNTPELTELFVQDESPARALQRVMKKLSGYWMDNINALAPELAAYYAKKNASTSDYTLKRLLRKRGFSVNFQMSRPMNDALQAVMGENVSLIKSIASEYFTNVEGAVLRAVAEGRDLKTLMEMLGDKVDLGRIKLGRKPNESDKSLVARTRRRAAFIARDQANKATAVTSRVRQQELGIKEAVWVHSGGGKHPRPEHQEWSVAKKRYNIAEGMYSAKVKKFIWPGTEPNCRCVSRSVMPWEMVAAN